MAKLISKTYGDALFEVALKNHAVDRLDQEAKVVARVFRENPDFIRLLKHPDIGRDEKQQILQQTFAGRISDELYGFLRVLVDKNRQGNVLEILDYFAAKVREYRRIGVVYITSALPLDAGQKRKIEKKVLATSGYSSLEPHYSVDRELIGGVVIRIGDRVVDGSVRSKLDRLTRELRGIQLSNTK